MSQENISAVLTKHLDGKQFIDEFDLEVVNQSLNFDTSDCTVTGGCDIFTTKPVASDKKLYKTIDRHLDSLLQENESFNAAVQRGYPTEENTVNPDENKLDANSSNSFWEQKRRMSVSENANAGNGSSPVFKSNKLNDQNLKDFVLSSDNNTTSNGYLSSSSMESGPTGYVARPSGLRRTSSAGSVTSIHTDASKRRPSTSGSVNENMNTPGQRRRSSVQGRDNVNIGPFGPINETASRRAFAYLIAILNASYPDHDFSSLQPTDFVKCSRKSFISKFENTLISLGKPPQEWIWETINSHMDIHDCAFYQYVPQKSFLEDEPGHLWSLMWFLFNKKRKRVAYIYLSAFRLKGSSSLGNSAIIGDEDEDGLNKLNTEGNSRSKLTLDNENDFDGEYDLTNEENAILDDDDDDDDDDMNNDFGDQIMDDSNP